MSVFLPIADMRYGVVKNNAAEITIYNLFLFF